jgi:hypothetical protein
MPTLFSRSISSRVVPTFALRPCGFLLTFGHGCPFRGIHARIAALCFTLQFRDLLCCGTIRAYLDERAG